MQNISIYSVACQAPINKSTTVESCRIFIIIVSRIIQCFFMQVSTIPTRKEEHGKNDIFNALPFMRRGLLLDHLTIYSL